MHPASPRRTADAATLFLCALRTTAQRGRHAASEPGAEDEDASDPAWLLETPVSDAMTPDPVFVHPGALLADAAVLLARHGVNRLPVLDHGRLVGILARGDVMAALARGGEGSVDADTYEAAVAAAEAQRDL
jgi:CBS-domain-containing membrane protein